MISRNQLYYFMKEYRQNKYNGALFRQKLKDLSEYHLTHMFRKLNLYK